MRRSLAFSFSSAAGILSPAILFVLLAHPDNLLFALSELPGILFLVAIAAAPGLLVIGLISVTLAPTSRVFAPVASLVTGGVLGLAVMQCWGYLFGHTLLYPDWERDRALFRLCAACSGSIAMFIAGYFLRTAKTIPRQSGGRLMMRQKNNDK